MLFLFLQGYLVGGKSTKATVMNYVQNIPEACLEFLMPQNHFIDYQCHMAVVEAPFLPTPYQLSWNGLVDYHCNKTVETTVTSSVGNGWKVLF